MTEITGTYKIDIEASKDVGFFGLYSGEKKNRLLLGGENDKTNRLAIACFADNEYPDGEDTKWVRVNITESGVSKSLKLDIRSIEVRLGISRDEIFELKNNGEGKLEKTINEKAKAYQEDLKTVKNFRKAVIDFLNSDGDEADLTTFKAVCDRFKPRGTLNPETNILEGGIQNKEIRALGSECLREFNHIFSRVDEYEKNYVPQVVERNVPQKPEGTPNVDEGNVNRKLNKTATYKSNFEKILRRFDRELFGIDRNFSTKSAENNVIRTLWGDTKLLLSRAPPLIGFKSSKKLALRLELNAGDKVYSVLTNGKIYHKKPDAPDGYVPFSKDGRTWVLLKVKSLSALFSVKPQDIEKAAKNPIELYRLILERDNVNKKIDQLIENFQKAFNDRISPDIVFEEFISTLLESPYYTYQYNIAERVKNIFKLSDDLEIAMVGVRYLFNSTNGLKITKRNIAEFADSGLFIDKVSKDIPVKFGIEKEDVQVHIQTDGFVYTSEPAPSEAYNVYEFKPGYWILLNKFSPVYDLKRTTLLANFFNNDKVKKLQSVSSGPDRHTLERTKIINELIESLMSEEVKDKGGILLACDNFLDKYKNHPDYQRIFKVYHQIVSFFLKYTKSVARLRIDYFMSETSDHKIKVTADNIADFVPQGLIIDYDYDYEIPLRMKLGSDKNQVAVETSGFVYTQEPESTKEFLPFQLKNGFWALLNFDFLISGGISLDKIKEILNNPEELNKLINSSQINDGEQKHLPWRI